MSKKLLLGVMVGALLLTAVFGVALAQGTNPPAITTPAPDDAYQFGQRFPFAWDGMGGHGMMGGMFGGHMMGMGMIGGGWEVYDAVAAALNLTPTQLFEQLHGGKTLAEIADAQGVELADVTAAAQAAGQEAMKARIEAAVKAGQLTQEQADRMLQGMEQGNMGRGMMGRGGFFRNWRGMPFFGGQQQQTPGTSF